MKVKVYKGVDNLVVIPLDFLCSPLNVNFENLVKSAILCETTRTCFSLDKNLPDTSNFKIEKTIKVDYLVEDLPTLLFLNVELPNKLIKEYKTLYLQNGFYFKSLTDNFNDNEREISVNNYVESIVKTVKEFGGNIENGGLMETVFNGLSYADEVSDKSAYLLCLTARITKIAKSVFSEFGSDKHDPFLFSEENYIE